MLLRAAEAVESPVWPFGHNDLGEDPGSGHFYRPLWVLWNAGLLELFGDEPAAFHAGNLLLFALIAIEVLFLARALLPPVGALVAALAFALYPRHGESVAWASGSTDLLAVAIGLGALLCLVAPWAGRRRILAAAALTAAAALAKEAAFLLPVLGVLLLFARGDRSRGALLAGPAAMAAALVAVFAVRTVVLGGLGGYGEDSVGPGRVAGSAVSYAVAAVSPSQLELLRYPALLVVPLALAAGLAWGVWRAGGARRRVALAGLAWFALALLPVLGLPLDLNSSNGERLMLLPSVGLALSLGALVPERPRPAAAGALAAAGLAAALLCLDVGRSWDRAGAIADRVVRQAAALAPAGGRLLVVTLPDSYRSAHVFTNSFDVAVSRAGAGADRGELVRPGAPARGARRADCGQAGRRRAVPGRVRLGGPVRLPGAARPRTTGAGLLLRQDGLRRHRPRAAPQRVRHPGRGLPHRPRGVLRRARHPPPACRMTRNLA